MNPKENPLPSIISRCWRDEAFKQKLLADPVATLKAEGIDVPAGVAVNIVVDTENVRTLVIPPAPKSLDDEQLNAVDGGFTQDGCGAGPLKYLGAGWY
jgi:hypothetical protein